MNSLAPIRFALGALSDAELRAIVDATNGAPPLAPGLLAWLEAACEWELNRRACVDYELQPPEAAIPPEEADVSISVAMAMNAAFAQDSAALRALFNALVELLSSGERKH